MNTNEPNLRPAGLTLEQEIARRRQLDAEELARKNAAVPAVASQPAFVQPTVQTLTVSAAKIAPVAAPESKDEAPQLKTLSEAEEAIMARLQDLNALRQLARKLNIKI